MGYDAALADRIREHLLGEEGVTERRMFGGLGFMVNGHMAVAASHSGDLLLRVDPATSAELVDGDTVRPMEMRGRAMNGWLLVAIDAVETDDALEQWVDRGVAFVRALPPK